MKDKITLRLFDIDDDYVEDFFVELKDNTYYITIKFKPIYHYCKICGSMNIYSKGNYRKILISNPINNRPVRIISISKRFICQDCHTSFIDDNPLDYDNTSFTRLAIITILDRLKPYNSTYSQISYEYGISTQKVIDIFDQFVQIKRKTLPRVLLIDEFYFNRHAKFKYPCLLMNFENKLIIDVVESRRHVVLSSYFFSIPKKEREAVEYICTDMSYTFKSLINIFFPTASHLVDHFHVTKYVNDQLNNTRKRVMRKHSHDKHSLNYRLLKNKYRILLKCHNDIDNETYSYDYLLNYHATENHILETLLAIDEELRKAYFIKEEYLAFDQCSKEEISKCDKRQELESLIKKMKYTNVEEFTEAADLLKRWKEEILTSFIWIGDRRISNGPIEGKNNYIKKILSNANGMSNFDRSRNRIMYSQNKYEKHKLK